LAAVDAALPPRGLTQGAGRQLKEIAAGSLIHIDKRAKRHPSLTICMAAMTFSLTA
jgi:hypothetical protein